MKKKEVLQLVFRNHSFCFKRKHKYSEKEAHHFLDFSPIAEKFNNRSIFRQYLSRMFLVDKRVLVAFCFLDLRGKILPKSGLVRSEKSVSRK